MEQSLAGLPIHLSLGLPEESGLYTGVLDRLDRLDPAVRWPLSPTTPRHEHQSMPLNSTTANSPPSPIPTFMQHLCLSRLPSPRSTASPIVVCYVMLLRCQPPQVLPQAMPTQPQLTPVYASTYTSARFGYLKSAFSSRYSIHCLRNALPLSSTLATFEWEMRA